MTTTDGGHTEAERAAIRLVECAFGSGSPSAVGEAPGRVTLVGEHVDYVGGRVVCMAIDRTLAVAVRASADNEWRAANEGLRVQRRHPTMVGDIGDRIFAAALALGERGIAVPPIDVAVAGNLPSSVGLSSSAAVITASLVAMLRMVGARLAAEDVVAAAVSAERDIVGVPNGELDQRAVVHSRADSVLALDCASGSRWTTAWPWPEVGVLVASSGERHDVGGSEYRIRRDEAVKACALLGVASCQEIGERWRELPGGLQPHARHVATETQRSDEALAALAAGDAAWLGRLFNESHQSLRRDHNVSTPRLDAMVEAARRVSGCYGARLVGAGFGGSAIALVERPSALRCAVAMAQVSGIRHGTWLVEPSAGLEVTAFDAVGGATAEDAPPRRSPA